MTEVFNEVHRLLTEDPLFSSIFKISFGLLGLNLLIRIFFYFIFDLPFFVDFSSVWSWMCLKFKILAIKLFGMERLISWGLAVHFVDLVDCKSVGDCENCPFEEFCTEVFIKDMEDPAEPVK